MRPTRILNVLDGEAVFSMGSNGIFSATALKTLKRHFGNPLFNRNHSVQRIIFLCGSFTKNWRTWLSSIGYETPLLSYENMSKVITTLPHNLRQDFFKVTRNSNLLDWNINLIGLADWLEGRLKTCFNPLTEIIALQDQANLSKLH